MNTKTNGAHPSDATAPTFFTPVPMDLVERLTRACEKHAAQMGMSDEDTVVDWPIHRRS